MASPFGAVGLYIANNTIKYGLAFGLILAVSATIPDVFYAWVAAYSLAMASTFFADKALLFEVLGGLIAIGMGVYLLNENPEGLDKKETSSKQAKNKLVAVFVTFGMVALYVKTILLTGIAFAMFSLNDLISSGFKGLVILTCGVAAGAFSAYGGIAYATHRVRGLLTADRLILIHRFAGVIMLILGFAFLGNSILKHYGISFF